jgi:NADH-quinone oxidoreductase subunit L
MDAATLKALPLIVLLMPLAASVIILLGGRRSRGLSAGLSIGAVGIGLALSAFLFGHYLDRPPITHEYFQWLALGKDSLNIAFAVRLDQLSTLMLLVVTLVATLVHIFSLAYMRDDKGFARYFAGLSLFVFSMLGIVLASNFVLLFIFWELVGVSSYLLISHWYEKSTAAEAGKKAFLTNRIGDVGFLLGILFIWHETGSLNFTDTTVSTVAGLLIFCGAVGKSAQFPLHVWLPDAMEGPTPVSALIHAATMVAAGVYLLCRVFFIFTDDALLVIAWIGGLTALIAALIAVQQNDIKRILAYSTLSQLGYMVMAVGCAGPAAAMFHLTTHAAFKALLFLGAGAVIYSCHHEQDIWKMGGLRQRMPRTFICFVVGALALAGVPLLSGFYSKDAILMQAWLHQTPLFYLGVAVAALTAFYMMRCVLVAFFGEARTDAAREAPQAKLAMVVPLMILTMGSIILGQPWLGLDRHTDNINDWDKHALIQFNRETEANRQDHNASGQNNAAAYGKRRANAHNVAMAGGTMAAALGLLLGWFVYRNSKSDPLPAKLGRCSDILRDRFYFDELYVFLNRWTQESLSRVADWFDRWIIAGAVVRGISGTVDITATMLRLCQSGNLRNYALLLAIGLLLMLGVFLF